MIGWRAKLGVIIPSCNKVLEPEFYRIVPSGISVHFSRVKFPDEAAGNIKWVEEAEQDIPRASKELADAGVDVIAYGCTGGSFYKGTKHDKKIVAIIEKTSNVRATTTSTAVLEALKEVGVKKLSILAPYKEWLVERLRTFFESNGFTVVALNGLGEASAEAIANIPPEKTYRLVREVNTSDSDAVFISCTDYRTIEILDILENDLEKPVMSSNQATLWLMLKMAGIKQPIKGFGTLLTRL